MDRALRSLVALFTATSLISCSNLSGPFTADPGTDNEPVSEIAAGHSESQLPENSENADNVFLAESEGLEPELQAEPAHLLAELASEFTWPRHVDNSKVKHEIRALQKRPEHFNEILERGEHFLPLIRDKLAAAQLPAELAFVPFVESGYYPSAQSRSGAAGLWQFIPSTSRYLGMHTDWWYDERLDIEVSTDKALEYLTYLNNRFNGNWELTLAAYNGGEGHISSRIKRADGLEDFWSLKLKSETSAYVPKILAVVEIVANPDSYGMQLPEIARETKIAPVQLENQVDLRLAAKEVGLSYQDLKALNSGYLRWITPPAQKRTLLVPASQASTLIASMEDITSDEQLAWNHYRVQRGDTLIDIAREFGTTLRALVAVNQIEGSRIYENQDLLIPTSELPLTRLASQAQSVKQLYIVKTGDSLWEISRDQGVTISQIRRLNGISGNKIKPGQVLVLAETFTGQEFTYLVKRGDSLSEIASRFKVAVADIRAWNSLDGDLIKPGQELRIRTESQT